MKKINYFSILLIPALAFALQSCGGTDTTQSSSAESAAQVSTEVATETAQATQEAPAEAVADANPYAQGEAIYNAKCIVCHQANGEGIPGAFPPLKNSDYLLADKVRAVAQALNGSNHEITVNGSKYSAPMPPQVDTHEEAVAVINYVLNAWGNNGGTVTLEEVKDIVIEPRP